VGKGGKAEKRPVTVGKRNERQVEITAGLAEGDQVLLEKPKE
jgi:multidrug efflux pump subunit AcrA (membrane-fusion protein)